jgi:hypothetical protein
MPAVVRTAKSAVACMQAGMRGAGRRCDVRGGGRERARDPARHGRGKEGLRRSARRFVSITSARRGHGSDGWKEVRCTVARSTYSIIAARSTRIASARVHILWQHIYGDRSIACKAEHGLCACKHACIWPRRRSRSVPHVDACICMGHTSDVLLVCVAT